MCECYGGKSLFQPLLSDSRQAGDITSSYQGQQRQSIVFSHEFKLESLRIVFQHSSDRMKKERTSSVKDEEIGQRAEQESDDMATTIQR